MIIDALENVQKYFKLHPAFQEAFEFLRNETDLEKAADGTIVDSEKFKGFVVTFQGISKETSLLSFECHDKNIDIQYCIKGRETFGWKPRGKCGIHNGVIIQKKTCDFLAMLPICFLN